MGVTKGVEVEKVQEAAEAGVSIFGENYVQEAKGKIASVEKKVTWHMIGHLQRNKANDAIRFFDVIETVDSPRLAETLDKRAKVENRVLEIFVQVDLSREGSKSGVNPDEIFPLIADISKRKNLRLCGLMTIAPFFEEPEKARPYFRALRELRDSLHSEGLTGEECLDLSMGMSGDYEVAIEEGATILRIGTAIFGPRMNNQQRR
jgi:pyridoxal phosphate enzyme (YggS family)